MAGQNRKSQVQDDATNLCPVLAALPDPVMECPVSSVKKGKMAGPVLNFIEGEARNHDMVEGGPSICRDGDPPPLVFTVSEDRPLEAAPSTNLHEAAFKVHDKSPERKTATVQSVPSAPAADLHCSKPRKTHSSRSYADVVSNTKVAGVEHQSKINSADHSRKFAEAKTSFNKSFYDNDNLSNFGHISEFEGRKVISFSTEELAELATPFEFTLVGKFSHGFPTMKILKSIMGNLNLKGSFSIALLEHKHVLIRLSCEEDYTRLWSRQVWFMAGFPMRIFKWTPDFDPLVESPFAPVWVLFPYLPVHLFDKRSLFQIASVLGKPLRIDSATAELTRPSTPRVCIEIDVTQASLPEIEIRLGGKIRMQPVEYENLPSYCSFCKHLGHDIKSCKSFLKTTSSVLDDISLISPPKEVNVAAAAHVQPGVQVSPLPLHGSVFEDSISLDSKGIITFTPGPNNPTNKLVNFSKIKDDVLQSYDRFDNVSEVGSENMTIGNPVYFNHIDYVAKNFYSEDDCPDSESEPIVLPPKKKVQKKVKSNTVKPNKVEDRVGTDSFELDISVGKRNKVLDRELDLDLGFQTVMSKKKQKGEKARKKLENGS